MLTVSLSLFDICAVEGPNSHNNEKNKGKLGKFESPRRSKDMPTPCQYNLMQWTEQRPRPWASRLILGYMGMVLACPCLALDA